MIKVILRLDCGIGMHSADSFLVTDEDWKEYANGNDMHAALEIYAWDSAVGFAEGYGIYPESDRPDEFDEDHAGYGDTYSDDIEGWFELYNPDEHDGLKVGGSDWDWKEL
jgi:hypothetical protein